MCQGGVFGSRLGPDMQVYMALFLVNIFIVVHLAASPFDELTESHKILHWLELGALVVCWVTLYSGMLFWLGATSERLDSGFLTFTSFSIIFGNVVFGMLLMYVFGRAIRLESKEGGDQSEEALRRLIQQRSKKEELKKITAVADSSDTHLYAIIKMQNQVRLSMAKQKAHAANSSRKSGRSRLKRKDTVGIANMVQETASEHSQRKKKELEGRRKTSMSRLKNRLERRQSRAMVAPKKIIS